MSCRACRHLASSPSLKEPCLRKWLAVVGGVHRLNVPTNAKHKNRGSTWNRTQALGIAANYFPLNQLSSSNCFEKDPSQETRHENAYLGGIGCYSLLYHPNEHLLLSYDKYANYPKRKISPGWVHNK